MTYRVEIERRASKEIAALQKKLRGRVLDAIEGLSEEPRPDGVKALQGFVGLLRLRIGDVRIVYTIDDNKLIVLVVLVGDRRDVYERLMRLGF